MGNPGYHTGASWKPQQMVASVGTGVCYDGITHAVFSRVAVAWFESTLFACSNRRIDTTGYKFEESAVT